MLCGDDINNQKFRLASRVIGFLTENLFSMGRVKVFFVLVLGVLSSVLQMVAFVFAVKVAINLTANEALSSYVDVNSYILMSGVVFFILILWAFSTWWYRLLLVSLDSDISESVLRCNVGIQESYYSRVTGYSFPYINSKLIFNKYPGVVSACCKSIITLLVALFVLFVTSLALFYVDYIITLCMLGVLSVFVLIVFPQVKRSRVAKSNYENSVKIFGKGSQKIYKRFELGRGFLVGEDGEEVLTLYCEMKKSLYNYNSAVEGAALTVGLYAAITIGGLMLWFALFRDLTSVNDLTELVILLVLLRFFSAYCNRAFRSISTLNALLSDVLAYIGYRDRSENGIEDEELYSRSGVLICDSLSRSGAAEKISKVIGEGKYFTPVWVLQTESSDKTSGVRYDELFGEDADWLRELQEQHESCPHSSSILNGASDAVKSDKHILIVDGKLWLKSSEFCRKEMLKKEDVDIIVVAKNGEIAERCCNESYKFGMLV